MTRVSSPDICYKQALLGVSILIVGVIGSAALKIYDHPVWSGIVMAVTVTPGAIILTLSDRDLLK